MDLNECGLILLGLLGRRWMVVIFIKFREGIGVVGCIFNRFLFFGLDWMWANVVQCQLFQIGPTSLVLYYSPQDLLFTQVNICLPG